MRHGIPAHVLAVSLWTKESNASEFPSSVSLCCYPSERASTRTIKSATGPPQMSWRLEVGLAMEEDCGEEETQAGRLRCEERQVEVVRSRGMAIADAIRSIGVMEVTLSLAQRVWRSEVGPSESSDPPLV
jgi:hypothetical protein